MKRFHIVGHSYTASLSIRTRFYETNNIFYFKNLSDLHKNVYDLWMYIQNESNVSLDTFRNFAFVSTYLQTKTVARKEDCAIFFKTQIPRH